MNTFFKISAAAGLITLLSGCVSMSDINAVDNVRALNPVVAASDFNKALATDYAAYAVYESEQEGEWNHGGSFARKAIAAAKNEAVEPETVTDWPIPNDRVIVLNKARIMMLDVFNRGGRDQFPGFAGRAQGQFDCWVEEEAEGYTDSGCMANHKAAMRRIKLEAPAAAPVQAPVADLPPFIVLFGFDSAAFDNLATGTITSIAQTSVEVGAKSITLIGHTDRSGNVDYNMALSKKRVMAVADALAAQNTGGAKVITAYAGETSPTVKSGNDRRETMNRRVEVLLER